MKAAGDPGLSGWHHTLITDGKEKRLTDEVSGCVCCVVRLIGRENIRHTDEREDFVSFFFFQIMK